MKKQLMKRKVSINGTDVNPYHKLGLTQNPFPELGKYEWQAGELALNSLGGDPIKSADEIRVRLGDAVSKELVDLCVAQYKPGEMVDFIIYWKE